MRSNDGDALMWMGTGVGKPTGKGLAATWRYTWIMQTMSSRWSRLNGVVGVGEWEVDENGNGKAQLREVVMTRDFWAEGFEPQAVVGFLASSVVLSRLPISTAVLEILWRRPFTVGTTRFRKGFSRVPIAG